MVVFAVVSDRVPFLDHPPDQFRRPLDIIPGDKKRRPNLFLRKGVQNLFGVPVFIPLVKGQIDRFQSRNRRPDKIRPVLPVLFLKLKAGDRTVFRIDLPTLSPALPGFVKPVQRIV